MTEENYQEAADQITQAWEEKNWKRVADVAVQLFTDEDPLPNQTEFLDVLMNVEFNNWLNTSDHQLLMYMDPISPEVIDSAE